MHEITSHVLKLSIENVLQSNISIILCLNYINYSDSKSYTE